MRIFTAALTCSLALLGMHASPDITTPTLNSQKALVVKVRAQGGAALQGVRVCAGTATNTCVEEAQTSGTGLAVLQNVPYRSIRVTATKDGYALAKQDMNFNARSAPLDVFLQPGEPGTISTGAPPRHKAPHPWGVNQRWRKDNKQ